MIIENGVGNATKARVDGNNQLHIFAVTEDEQNSAAENGQLYNINTGLIALTGTSDSAILYFKNNESPINGESNIIITSIIFGLYTRSATVTNSATATIIRNPTAGTIIDDATAVSMKSNANFGSSNTLDSLIYKASGTGKTLTDGTDHAIALLSEGRTAIPELNIDLAKGSSLGIKVDLNTSGGADIYAALVCYRKDGKNIYLILCGGDKSTQKKDIKLAKHYWSEHKRNR